MIDYDYETRLVDRIAVREAATERLRPREKRILSRYTRYGDTYEEIGEREGITRERVRQIHLCAIQKLQQPLTAEARPLLKSPATRSTTNTPPPGFNRAEFLRHMRGLIEKREKEAREQQARDEEYARNWRKREREALDRIMRNEELQGLFDPPPPPKQKPPPPPRPQPQWQAPPSPRLQPTPVEPWFNPTRMPTPEDMRRIAQYALNYFTAARGLVHAGRPSVQPAEQMAHAVCARDADAIAHALMRWAREIPQSARFSAYPLPVVPDRVLAATITSPYLSLQVASVEDGQKVSMVVMFD